MRYVLIFTGFVSLGLGILGIFLPVLPTTPFLLLTAWLFAHSSERLHKKLLNHKIVGRHIRDFRKNRTIPLKIKIISITTLWVTILIALFFAVSENMYLQMALLAVAIGVSMHILSYKTRRKNNDMTSADTKNTQDAFLYTGLIFLAAAFTAKWSSIPSIGFWILFGIAVILKVLFLISVFRVKGFKPSLWLYLILAGITVMLTSLFFRTVALVPATGKILFFVAVLLKISGLAVLLFSKLKNLTSSRNLLKHGLKPQAKR